MAFVVGIVQCSNTSRKQSYNNFMARNLAYTLLVFQRQNTVKVRRQEN